MRLRCECGRELHEHFQGTEFCMVPGSTCEKVRHTLPDLAPTERYLAQWYESNDSMLGPTAHTDDDGPWAPEIENDAEFTKDWKKALKRAQGWASGGGHFKTCRVVVVDVDTLELVDDEPVVWESNRRITVEV